MLRRSVTALILLLVLALLAVFAMRRWYWPDYASSVAIDAAEEIGRNLLTFNGPTRSGSVVFGSDAYHWERIVAGIAAERVTYLRADQRLCWTALEAGSWQDKGCINTRTYEK